MNYNIGNDDCIIWGQLTEAAPASYFIEGQKHFYPFPLFSFFSSQLRRIPEFYGAYAPMLVPPLPITKEACAGYI
jgi:hypothetical protein